VIELVLLAKIVFLQSQVGIGEELPAEVAGAFKTRKPAASRVMRVFVTPAATAAPG
jgi:hypothetical protein